MMQFWIYTLSKKVKKMEKKSKSGIRCTHTHAEKTHTASLLVIPLVGHWCVCDQGGVERERGGDVEREGEDSH